MNFFLLFNHTLTPDQETDARTTLGVDTLVALPADLQAFWSNVPPELPDLSDYVAPIVAWLSAHAHSGDHALVQGDYGATYLLVQHCLSIGVIPVHGTTARKTQELPQADGSIKIERVFRHERFRRYA